MSQAGPDCQAGPALRRAWRSRPPATRTGSWVQARRRLAALLCVGAAGLAAAAAQEAVSLPAPDRAGGKPLMQALQDRRSLRDFSPGPLTPRQLSDLLWAAFGINRPENDHRTAPSAKNAQEMDLYVAMADGLFRYDAKPHRLVRVSGDDVRRLTSGQDFAKVAPVALIYVADFTRFKDTTEADALLYAAFDAGCISENVYLYCASAGLATVVHDLDRRPLAAQMELGEGQHIIMAQAVGAPK